MNRTTPPQIKQAKELKLVFPDVIECANGARIFWNKETKDEAVKMDLEWWAGSKYQSVSLAASYTNKLLLSGNAEMSAKAIAERIDFYGGYTQFELDRDHAGLTLYGLSRNMSDIFSTFATAFELVDFQESEFKKEISIGKNRFKIACQKVKTVGQRAFSGAIFGTDSIYGRTAVEEDFDKIQRADLQAFYTERYANYYPDVFLVGQVSDAFITEVSEWLEKFPSGQPKGISPVFAAQKKGRIMEEVTNTVQSAVRVGRTMFDKKHPDYFNFQLLNTVLGGYFGSRLMTNIREDKGYTYGIGSGLSVMEHNSYFGIVTEVGNDVREDAIREIFTELKKLREELIPEDELQRVKNYMLGDFLRNANGPISMMENFKNIHFNQLKDTYYTDFIQAIHKATAEDLQRVAQEYLKEEDLLTVIAG